MGSAAGPWGWVEALGKATCSAWPLEKDQSLEKDHLLALTKKKTKKKKKGLDVPMGLGKELPSMQLGYVEVAHSHMIGARNQSCGSGPLPHNWLQLHAGQFLQKLSPGYALQKAANMEFRAAQHAAGANYVEVAHSHMIGARNQSCGSGSLPHN